jgi:hypothetical protein
LARIWLVDRFVPAGIGAGTGVEESTSGVDEGFGAIFVEAEIAREAEMGESVPVVRATTGGGVFGILREEFSDGGFVGEDGSGVDVRGGYVRVAFEDELRVFERAGAMVVVTRDAGGVDKGGDGIGQVGEGADETLGFKVSGELWPALEAVLAGDDELGVSESEAGGADLVKGEFVEGGSEGARCGESRRGGLRDGSGGVLWLVFCIVRGWDEWVAAFQTYEAPFGCCLDVRMSQAERSSLSWVML